MSSEHERGTHQVWRVETPDGSIDVPVWRGASYACTTSGVQFQADNPRQAVLQAAVYERWPVESILAPGQPSRAELRAQVEIARARAAAFPMEETPSIEAILQQAQANHGLWVAFRVRDGVPWASQVILEMEQGCVFSRDQTGVSVDSYDVFVRSYAGARWMPIPKEHGAWTP